MRYPNQSKQKQQQQSTEEQQQSEPKKKKKKTDSKDNLTPKSNSPLDPENVCAPNTTLTSRFPQTLSKKNIIDIYYSMICDHFIFIEKPVLEKYILSKSNSEDVDDSELPLKKEMQTFFFSVTALVEQRMGMGDLSEKSAKKARDCLSKLFDEMNNFVVACSYANLGSYEIGSGRVKLSRFYFHNAKFYFESLDDSEKSRLSEHEKALQKYLTSVEIVNADNDLGISAMIHDMPKVFHFTTGHHLPQEIVKATQQEVSPSNCLDYLKIVEMIASYLNKYFRGMATKTRGEKEMEMYDKGSNLCQGLLMNGLRVGVLTKAGYGKDLIEESSLRITYASESEFFPFLPVIVIPHVALAARIHLQIVKKIENGTRQNHQKGLTFQNTVGPIDYFDILAKDYRSLIILSKRFKRVSVCYGSLLDEIKEILGRRVEAQQNNDTTSTNNSNTVTTPIADDALLQPLSLDSSSLPPLSFLLGSMNDNPSLPQSSSSQKSTLDGYASNNLQQSIFNSIIQSPIKSPSQQQELYFADPFFTHEDLQQIFSPHTYGDFEDVSEYSFNVK
ncbi:predicted protein [Naegleria gruberi]|uniref:Predicted protein n=1 Tax=Naegleria gruberi TaxID=5762 RepID=D2VVV4_NAEGR|nr:uncharacterized protein NAEGRDRAFT_73153 [Naegleria gruberi]EFC39109.1 predicted protein [Naegleria gruberi]|eukprot:XP_002671853.1 predicted protein [Naegleria gruberi strain NEG-M]